MPLVVLSSPLLPADAYSRLAEALTRRGHETVVADPGESGSGAAVVDTWSATVRADEATALVAHSNAGYLAPGVRAAVDGRLPVVFMDAALPPDDGPTRLAPESFRAFLGTLPLDAGRLPPWTRWWPRDDMDEVIPPDAFTAIDAACPRLLLGYFDSEVSPPAGWAAGRNAYLAFGDTYAEEVARARGHRWPTVEYAGTHLQFLWEPGVVAGLVVGLVAELAGDT